MALSIEGLLAPVSEAQPVGEDLSYDPERYQIEQAFETGEYGADAAESDDTDWRGTIKLIEQQFARTKDIWLATYLCRAGARSGSLETVELGAQVLAGLFEQYWDTVHPQLEELGLPGRKAPCDSLAARKDFLGPLERVILVAHPRLGAYSGADFERFRVGAESEDGYGLFRAAIDDLGDVGLTEVAGRIDRIEEGLKRADKVFTDAAAGEASPNFAPTYATLATLRNAIKAFIQAGEGATEEEGEAIAESGDSAPSGGSGGKRISGAVESREDVARAFDAIADYYRRREPSHPVQLIVQRAKAWIGLDFLELLRDIAPDSISEATRLLNKRDAE